MAEAEVDDKDTVADDNAFTRLVCIADFEACGYLVRAGDGNMSRGLGHSLWFYVRWLAKRRYTAKRSVPGKRGRTCAEERKSGKNRAALDQWDGREERRPIEKLSLELHCAVMLCKTMSLCEMKSENKGGRGRRRGCSSVKKIEQKSWISLILFK